MESSPGQRLRQWRDYKDLTLADISRLTGIRTTTLSTTEQPGGSNPSYDTISKVLAAFPDLNPDWLLLGTGPMLRDGRALSQLPAPLPAPIREGFPAVPGTATPAEADFVGEVIRRLEEQIEDYRAREAWYQEMLKKPLASADAAAYYDFPRMAITGFQPTACAPIEARVVPMYRKAA